MAQQRGVFADVEAEGRILRVATQAIELRRRPRFQATDDGRRKTHTVRRSIEHLARDDTRVLMLAVAISRRAGKHRDDHLRPERADNRDSILEQRILWPLRERLVERLGETEVEGAREVLATAVDTTSCKQLFGSDHAQDFAELVADEVLAAVAAGERQIRRL